MWYLNPTKNKDSPKTDMNSHNISFNKQGSANGILKAKSSQLLVCATVSMTIHMPIICMVAFALKLQNGVVAKEKVQPTKPKIPTI